MLKSDMISLMPWHLLKEKATEIIVRANHLDLDPVYTSMHVCDDVEDHYDHHNEDELADVKTLPIFHSRVS